MLLHAALRSCTGVMGSVMKQHTVHVRGGVAGPELLTHMVDGLATGKTWLRGSEGLPSPSCTQGPCKSRSVRTINCSLDGDVVILTYSRKVSLLLSRPYCTQATYCAQCAVLRTHVNTYCTQVMLYRLKYANCPCMCMQVTASLQLLMHVMGMHKHA